MSDTLKANCDSLRQGIEVLAQEASRLEGVLRITIADRDNMRRELEAIEKFLREQGVGG